MRERGEERRVKERREVKESGEVKSRIDTRVNVSRDI